MFRKADFNDIDKITEIYEDTHTLEEQGLTTTGWIRGIYPTRNTANIGVSENDMFVLEQQGRVQAAARINREQVKEYSLAKWNYDPPENEIMVLHTLVVSPSQRGRGLGKSFARFYEEYALKNGCRYLRIDTNERNLAARKMYKKLGYTEVGIIPCTFNGLENIMLVCLEKTLEEKNV